MQVLQYRGLDLSLLTKEYQKVVKMLEQDDFYSADVKKISGTKYYRAKLDHTNRVLFTIVSFAKCKYILMLEIIRNHAYDRSRFLGNAKLDLNAIELNIDLVTEAPLESINYLNLNNPYINILDRLISLDPIQEQTFKLLPPILIIGSAGSGKTLVALEKVKNYPGQILFVTASRYLVQYARKLYYANNYSNDQQEIDFLSYQEFIETIKVPDLNPLEFNIFNQWIKKYYSYKIAQDPNKLYEEFKGVLTADPNNKYLQLEEYLELGVKKSIFSYEERTKVYELFSKYLDFIKNHQLYDSNILAYEYLSICQARYDLVVVDEVQDLSQVQLLLILKSLLSPQQFILCGDSNQIVHPNFFSWAKIKSLFYQNYTNINEIRRILYKSYRNSKSIVNLANQLLKIKNIRFGSIDEESNYLMECHSDLFGGVYFLEEDPKELSKLNVKIAKSTQFAVLVLREEQKTAASKYFNTPLIFSIYEAKGLEYNNVILYNIISSEHEKFLELVKEVNPEDLEKEFKYSRNKDKTDRSLEIYKFYINSLYVAITRAIDKIYIIESDPKHKLFDLLNLNCNLDVDQVKQYGSSLDEWQQELERLELQGKKAQADLIKSTILHKAEVPWSVLTIDAVDQLKAQAWSSQPNKKLYLLLFEYAIIYQSYELLFELAQRKFMPAIKLDHKKSWSLLERKYFIGYGQNYSLILKQVDLYGVNFRNQFNQTPLMVASFFGNIALAEELKNKGADLRLVDNNGHNAWQIALAKIFVNPHFAKQKLGALDPLINVGELDLQVEKKLIKIDKSRMEFLLVNIMLSILEPDFYIMSGGNLFKKKVIFLASDLHKTIQIFPEVMVKEFRKKRSYITSILAKNEVNSNNPYNRKLFLRARRGMYILNPALKIKQGDRWLNVYELLNFKKTVDFYQKIFNIKLPINYEVLCS